MTELRFFILLFSSIILLWMGRVWLLYFTGKRKPYQPVIVKEEPEPLKPPEPEVIEPEIIPKPQIVVNQVINIIHVHQ